MARERIIEGRWNCLSCGAQGVLGRHKSCPGCGNPREHGSETSFDFGPSHESGAATAETVTDAALLQLAAAGADWHCGFCESGNRGDTATCRNCGADRADAQPLPPPAALPVPLVAEVPRRRRRWPYLLVLGMLVSCGFCFWAGSTHEVDGRVESRAWTRVVTRQVFTAVEKQGWKDELRVARSVMPVDGRGEVAGVDDVRGCVRRQKGTRQVPDGTRRVCDTKSRRVACGSEERCRVEDQGNGFAREVCHDVTKYCSESYEDCRDETQYRTEPVFGEQCTYRTWEWRDDVTRTARGTTDTPRWPELSTARLDRLVRTGEYRVEVRYGDDGQHTVKPATDAEFARWTPGAPVRLVVSNLGIVQEATPAPAR